MAHFIAGRYSVVAYVDQLKPVVLGFDDALLLFCIGQTARFKDDQMPANIDMPLCDLDAVLKRSDSFGRYHVEPLTKRGLASPHLFAL